MLKAKRPKQNTSTRNASGQACIDNLFGRPRRRSLQRRRPRRTCPGVRMPTATYQMPREATSNAAHQAAPMPYTEQGMPSIDGRTAWHQRGQLGGLQHRARRLGKPKLAVSTTMPQCLLCMYCVSAFTCMFTITFTCTCYSR